MPLPRSITGFNRRFTNRFWLKLAGHLPWFGIVTHVGRRSGRTFRTPINVFPTAGEYTIALTYGSESDWVKNVLAAGTCELETRGRRIQLANPRLMTDRNHRWAPLPVRLALNIFRVTQTMRLSPAGAASNS